MALEGSKFDIKRLIEEDNAVRVVHSDILGDISYCPLNAEELIAMAKIEDSEEQGKFGIYTMLHKADPRVEPKDVGELSPEHFKELLQTLAKSADFRAERSDGPLP
jgi:hypothetical protein